MLRSIATFGAVGALAALTHFSVAALLLTSLFQHADLGRTLMANALAFSVAFAVSYYGQRRWTFRSARSHSETLPRYLAVALLGLALNEGVVALCMHTFDQPPIVAVALGVCGAAACTFIVSRQWVFHAYESSGG